MLLLPYAGVHSGVYSYPTQVVIVRKVLLTPGCLLVWCGGNAMDGHPAWHRAAVLPGAWRDELKGGGRKRQKGEEGLERETHRIHHSFQRRNS